MPWVVYALVSIVFSVGHTLLNRVVAVDSENPRAGSLVYNIWGAATAIILFFITNESSGFAIEIPSLGIGILIAITLTLYGLFERTQFFIKKHIDASTGVILFRLAPAFTVLFSVLFLQESMGWSRLVGVVLILGGNLLIVWKNMQLRLNKYFWVGIVFTLVLGIAWTLDKPISNNVNSGLYTMLVWLVPLLLLVSHQLAGKQ